MWRHERMAGGRAARRAGPWHAGLSPLGRRHGRSATTHADRRRGRGYRRAARALHRYPARAARLGRGGDLRGDDAHVVCRRSVCALRARPRAHSIGDCRTSDRVGRSRIWRPRWGQQRHRPSAVWQASSRPCSPSCTVPRSRAMAERNCARSLTSMTAGCARP